MSRLAGIRVLIVEDEPVVAMGLEDMLMALGCSVIGPAGRLAEGLALARDAQADAAVLDINLAGERSDTIAAALRARGIPFVFASGYGNAPAGFEEGVPLLGKPYREADLAAALERVLA